MSKWIETCERCGCDIEVNLWSRERAFCPDCAAYLDSLPGPVGDPWSVGDRLPREWLDVGLPDAPETEVEREQRYTREDHRWAMDHPYWGQHPARRKP